MLLQVSGVAERNVDRLGGKAERGCVKDLGRQGPNLGRGGVPESRGGWKKGLLQVSCRRTKSEAGETGTKGLGGFWVCTKRQSPQRMESGGEEGLLQAGCYRKDSCEVWTEHNRKPEG